MLACVGVAFGASYEWTGASEFSDRWNDLANWKLNPSGEQPSTEPGKDDDVTITFDNGGQQGHVAVDQPAPITIKSLRVTGSTPGDDFGGLVIKPVNFTVIGNVVIDGAATLDIQVGGTAFFTAPNVSVTSAPGFRFMNGYVNAPVYVLGPSGHMSFETTAEKIFLQPIVVSGSGAVLDFSVAEVSRSAATLVLIEFGSSGSISAEKGGVVNVMGNIAFQYQRNTHPGATAVMLGDAQSWWYVQPGATAQFLAALTLQQMGINGGGELQVAVQAGFAQVLGAVRVDGTLVAKSPGLVADSITGGGVLKLGGISTSSRSRLEVQSELNGVTITAVATSPTDTLYVDSRVPSPTVQAINVASPFTLETDSAMTVRGDLTVHVSVTLIGDFSVGSVTANAANSAWFVGQAGQPAHITVRGTFLVQAPSTVKFALGSALTLPAAATFQAENSIDMVGAGARESVNVTLDSAAQLNFGGLSANTGYVAFNSLSLAGLGSFMVKKGTLLLTKVVFHVAQVALGTGAAFSGVVADLSVHDVRALDDTTKVTMNVSNVFVICPASCGAVTGATTAQFNFTTKAAAPPPPDTPPALVPQPEPVAAPPSDMCDCPKSKSGLMFFLGFLTAALIAAAAVAGVWFFVLRPKRSDEFRAPLNGGRV